MSSKTIPKRRVCSLTEVSGKVRLAKHVPFRSPRDAKMRGIFEGFIQRRVNKLSARTPAHWKESCTWNHNPKPQLSRDADSSGSRAPLRLPQSSQHAAPAEHPAAAARQVEHSSSGTSPGAVPRSTRSTRQ